MFPSAAVLGLAAIVLRPVPGSAGAISVDAGVTPPEDRWIVRAQVRGSRLDAPAAGGTAVRTTMVPVMVAYGVKRNVMVMARQAFLRRRTVAGPSEQTASGLGDAFVMTKVLAWRRNRSDSTLAVSGVAGTEAPTGDETFSPGTWNPRLGVFARARRGRWSTDANVGYAFNGLSRARGTRTRRGNELAIDWAASRQFSLRPVSRGAVSVVLEASYRNVNASRNGGRTMPGSGARELLTGPGLLYSSSWLFVEGLVKVPAWREEDDRRRERTVEWLAGTRLLF